MAKTEMPTEDIELLSKVSGVSVAMMQTIVQIVEEHLREKLARENRETE